VCRDGSMGKCCESKVLCWEKEAESTSAPELCSFHGPAAFSFPLVMAALRGCRHGTMPDEPPAAWLASPFPWDTWLRAGPQGFPPSGPFASWQPNFFLLAFLASLSVVLFQPAKETSGVCGRFAYEKGFLQLQKCARSFPRCSRYAKWYRVIV